MQCVGGSSVVVEADSSRSVDAVVRRAADCNSEGDHFHILVGGTPGEDSLVVGTAGRVGWGHSYKVAVQGSPPVVD